MITYPNVICDSHPGVVEPGYMLCRHVRKPNDALIELATKEKLGVVACSACWEAKRDERYLLHNFVICCAQSLRECGFDLHTH